MSALQYTVYCEPLESVTLVLSRPGQLVAVGVAEVVVEDDVEDDDEVVEVVDEVVEVVDEVDDVEDCSEDVVHKVDDDVAVELEDNELLLETSELVESCVVEDTLSEVLDEV